MGVDSEPPVTGAWLAGAALAQNGKIYLIGGEGSSSSNPLNLVQIFNPASNSWAAGSPMPTARYGLGVVLGPAGLIYAIGGRSSATGPMNVVEVYNPTSNTWSTAAPMPTARNQFATCVGSDGKIYVIGGKINYGNNSGPFMNVVEIYDPASDTWVTGTPYPMEIGEMNAALENNTIYVSGGTNGSAINNVFGFVTDQVGGWLSVNPTSGSVIPGATENITVTFDASELNLGTYDSLIVINSNDPDEPTLDVQATLQVGEAGEADINVTPDNLQFTVLQGDDDQGQLTISNEGTGNLNYSITWHESSVYRDYVKNENVHPEYPVDSKRAPKETTKPIIKLTASTSVTTILYEDFESGIMPPSGWTKVDGPSTPGDIDPAHWRIGDATEAYAGDYAAVCPWGYFLDEWLISPSLDFTNVTSPALDFWWMSSYYWHVDPNDNGDLFVKVSTDGGSTWDQLWTFGNIGVWVSWTWYQTILDLSVYQGQPDVLIAFQVDANDNGFNHIDEINVTGESGSSSWLTYAPPSGVVLPSSQQSVQINVTSVVNSTPLAVGTYSGNLNISSNDPDEALVQVPVTMNVVEDGECTPPYIQAADVFATQGMDVEVDISILDNPNPIDAFGFKFQFCSDKLSFVSAEKGDLINHFSFFQGNQTQPGVVTIGGFDATAVPAMSEGVIAKVTLHVDSCNADETCSLQIFNITDDLIGLNVCNGTWSCSQPCLLGDVNMDDDITPGDALCAFNIYLNDGTPPSGECDTECALYAADVNCTANGVTPGDALYIFLAYLDDEDPPLDCDPASVADQMSHPQLSLEQLNSAEYNEITFALEIDNPANVNAFGMNLGFPEDRLIFDRIALANLTDTWEALDARESIAGVLTIGGFNAKSAQTNESGTLAFITFKLKENSREEGDVWLYNFSDDVSGSAESMFRFSALSTDVRALDSPDKPDSYQLDQNYPNPFNLETEIVYQIPKAAQVTLELFNPMGQKIRTLISLNQSAGRYAARWDGRDESGQVVSSGIYFYKLKTSDFTSIKKLVLTK